jgi:dTDP-4-amino-4,6-dideoxygalactose transaminase
MDSAKSENLPIATKLADSVICLPIYADLKMEDVATICNLIKSGKI